MDTETLKTGLNAIDDRNAITVEGSEFLTELRQVAGAVAKAKDTRVKLKFVHAKVISSSELMLEATDGHVFDRTTVKADIDPTIVGRDFLIDGKFAKQLAKAPTKFKGEMTIYPKFETDGAYLGITAILSKGETYIDDSQETIDNLNYPQLQFLIDDADVQLSFETTKKELLPLLREAKKQTDAKNNYVVDIDSKLNLVSGGKVVKRVPLPLHQLKKGSQFNQQFPNCKENDLLISFNVALVINEIRHAKANETLTFKFWGCLQPFTINRRNGGFSMIAPMRKFTD